jgi:hypothetical protein
MMTYRGYTLDAFQREAIGALVAGESVLVSAPTGTGKTLIADYLTEATFKANRQVVYTAPIKALSNQKFKEFKALLGEENVGILTGDIVVNPQAKSPAHRSRPPQPGQPRHLRRDPLHRRSGEGERVGRELDLHAARDEVLGPLGDDP